MSYPPTFHQVVNMEPDMESASIKWLQELMNDSAWACGIPEDGVATKRVMQEISEMLYRLGHPTHPRALSRADFITVARWANGGNLPNDWQMRRIARLDANNGNFQVGWGITQASWECLHPGQFGGDDDVVRIMPTAVTGGSYGYGDPEGPGGRHWGIDWFGIEGAGTRVVSPVPGRVERVTESTDLDGQVFGGTISIRSKLDNWYWIFRHTNPSLRVGMEVKAGTPIGNVEKWRDGGDHVHLELYDERSVGHSHIYVGPPINRNPYLYLKNKGAL